MRYLILAALLLIPGSLKAETNSYLRPQINGVSVSSTTRATSTEVSVASSPALFTGIFVSSPGLNSFCEVFDSIYSTATETDRVGNFQTTTYGFQRIGGGRYGLYMSSGIAIFNRAQSGGRPAEVILFYEYW